MYCHWFDRLCGISDRKGKFCSFFFSFIEKFQCRFIYMWSNILPLYRAFCPWPLEWLGLKLTLFTHWLIRLKLGDSMDSKCIRLFRRHFYTNLLPVTEASSFFVSSSPALQAGDLLWIWTWRSGLESRRFPVIDRKHSELSMTLCKCSLYRFFFFTYLISHMQHLNPFGKFISSHISSLFCLTWNGVWKEFSHLNKKKTCKYLIYYYWPASCVMFSVKNNSLYVLGEKKNFEIVIWNFDVKIAIDILWWRVLFCVYMLYSKYTT